MMYRQLYEIYLTISGDKPKILSKRGQNLFIFLFLPSKVRGILIIAGGRKLLRLFFLRKQIKSCFGTVDNGFIARKS